MALNMYKKWVSLRSEERVRWCKASAIRHDNMSHFVTSVENILRSVNNLLRRGKRSQGDHKKSGETTEPQLNQDALHIEHTTTPRELNLYRLILTWVCSKNIMHQNTASDNPDWKARINIVESIFSVQDLEKLFIGASTISVKNDKKITNGALTVPVTIKFTGPSQTELPACSLIDVLSSFFRSATATTIS